MHALTPPPCVSPHAPRRCTRAARGVAARRTSAAASKSSSAGSAALSERVSQALRGTLLFVVGDNAAANSKLCDSLAASLGCGQQRTRVGAERCRAPERLTPALTRRVLAAAGMAATRRCTPSSCSRS
jgi:hypothetical protein